MDSAVTDAKLSAATLADLRRVIHEIPITTVTEHSGKLTGSAPVAFTINSFRVYCDSGSCVVTVKINGTPVTGMNLIAVSSTPTVATATALNSVSINDKVEYEITSNSTCLNFSLTSISEAL